MLIPATYKLELFALLMILEPALIVSVDPSVTVPPYAKSNVPAPPTITAPVLSAFEAPALRTPDVIDVVPE